MRTTRGRLTLIAVVVLGLALGIADAAIYGSFRFGEMKESDAVLTTEAGLVAPLVKEVGGRIEFERESKGGVAVDMAVIGPSKVLAQSPTEPLAAGTLLSLAREANKGDIWRTLTDSNGTARRVYARRVATERSGTLVLVATRSIKELNSSLNMLALLLASLSLPLLAVGGLLAYWLAGRVLNPVRTITGIARRLGEKDLHRRVTVRVPDDELGELVETFNGMLARLEASFESLRRFTADASHELRTPLTLMRTELEVALTKGRLGEDHTEVIRRVLGEVESLTRIVDHLLILARADASALRPARETIDVADFVNETAARWYATAARSQVQLVIRTPDEGMMVADPGLIRRVLDNLIDNAIRHAPGGQQVTVGAERRAGSWVIEVSDQGPGLSEVYRAQLFSRFAKPDGSRTRDGGGAGLGLALCAAIVKAHGGMIRVVTRPQCGAVFEVEIPDYPARTPTGDEPEQPRNTRVA